MLYCDCGFGCLKLLAAMAEAESVTNGISSKLCGGGDTATLLLSATLLVAVLSPLVSERGGLLFDSSLSLIWLTSATFPLFDALLSNIVAADADTIGGPFIAEADPWWRSKSDKTVEIIHDCIISSGRCFRLEDGRLSLTT